MELHIQRHPNVSKQTTLLDGVDVGMLKQRLCHSVHEGMKDILNVKVHLKTCSGHVNTVLSNPYHTGYLLCTTLIPNYYSVNLHSSGRDSSS